MNTEQINLKFLVHLRKTPSQAVDRFQQMYRDNTISHSCVFEWPKRGSKGAQGGARWLQELGSLQQVELRSMSSE